MYEQHVTTVILGHGIGGQRGIVVAVVTLDPMPVHHDIAARLHATQGELAGEPWMVTF